MCAVLALIFAFVLPVFASPAMAAKTPRVEAKWQNTFALVRQDKDPVAKSLLTWLYVTQTSVALDPRNLMRFVKDHPDWPRLYAVQRDIESEFKSGAFSAQETVAWFAEHPPLSASGISAYLDALLEQGKTNTARAALAAFWPEADLTKDQITTLAARYKSLFGKTAMTHRLDTLIWDGQYDAARTMLLFVSAERRALGYARIALATQAPDAASAVAKVAPSLRSNEGLLFERMRYRRRKDSGDSALEMLAAYKGKQTKPEIWWGEIHIMARRALERGDYRAAYRIASHHQLVKGPDLAAAEWLMGWLALRHLDDPVSAYRHFDRMYRQVGSAVSRARAAYWAAQAATQLKEMPTAQQWHAIAAFYPSTFYGQLSYITLHGIPRKDALASPAIPQTAVDTFHRHKLVRAVTLLYKVKLAYLADPFMVKLLSLAKNRDDFRLIARLAKKIGRPSYAVEANKQMQQAGIGFALEEGYPLLPKPLPKQPDAALIHAIVHRESMFDPKVVSHAGARGLMQLMPATAKAVAKKQGRKYKESALVEDPRYNVALGSAYLSELVDKYNGYYPMAIAAYNAGPSRVRTWIDLFGDPRRGDMTTLDWIEHIPIYETRNYVQRVMESYFLYRLKLGATPKTALDFTQAQDASTGR